MVLLLDWKEISVRQGQFRVPGEEDQGAISVMQGPSSTMLPLPGVAMGNAAFIGALLRVI